MITGIHRHCSFLDTIESLKYTLKECMIGFVTLLNVINDIVAIKRLA